MEMTVVIAIIAVLAAFGLPAIRSFHNAMVSSGGTRAMISASLASARALAAREQRYAGVRFQKAYSPDGPLEASQYMVFIVNDPDGTNLVNGFRVVEGFPPIRLPDSVGGMDLMVDGSPIVDDVDIANEADVNDTTTFSIVFSPSGKLIIHDVRVRNKDGKTNSDDSSDDEIFNTTNNVGNGIAMFYQDYDTFPFLEEKSRNGFIIYETDKFRQSYEAGVAYFGYLQSLINSRVYINPYTGAIINR